MKERQVAHQVKFYSPIHTIFIIVNCVLILAGLIGFIYGLTHYQIVSNASFIGGVFICDRLWIFRSSFCLPYEQAHTFNLWLHCQLVFITSSCLSRSTLRQQVNSYPLLVIFLCLRSRSTPFNLSRSSFYN